MAKKQNQKPRKPICADCSKRRASENHHVIPRCEGGTETIPLCRSCHVARHVRESDFARWGQLGGKKTAANKMNWIVNLKQYRPKDIDVTIGLFDNLPFTVENVL
jgi:hypothetical protein